jgi:hypothetical protein
VEIALVLVFWGEEVTESSQESHIPISQETSLTLQSVKHELDMNW